MNFLKLPIVSLVVVFLLGIVTISSYKAYAITNTSCANTSGGCCGGTDKDAYDSKNGLKITKAPQITCSGTTCSAKISLGGTYNAIVWAGSGACTSTGYCYKRPIGSSYTITGLQQGKTYAVKVSTSTSTGAISSGYGVEYPGGSCNYKLIANVTPSPSISPSVSPSVSPSTSPTQTSTKLNIALQLPGIGAGGNLSPHHTSRTLHLSIYAADVDPTQPNVPPLFDNKTLTLTYNNSTGYFSNTAVTVGNIATGDYQLLVKVPGYLRKQFVASDGSTTTIHIVNGTTTLVPSIKLIAGDVSPLYNVMDVSDFYAIVGCYKDKATSSTCSAGNQITDLNDDGTIDGIDLNYWLLGFQTLQANNNSNGNGDGVTGD